jgi:hypothetical protein
MLVGNVGVAINKLQTFFHAAAVQQVVISMCSASQMTHIIKHRKSENTPCDFYVTLNNPIMFVDKYMIPSESSCIVKLENWCACTCLSHFFESGRMLLTFHWRNARGDVVVHSNVAFVCQEIQQGFQEDFQGQGAGQRTAAKQLRLTAYRTTRSPPANNVACIS